MVTIAWFLFTIDEAGKETSFVQVRSFTSLIVLINIVKILAPTTGIVFPKLRLFEHKSLFTKDEKKAGGAAEKETIKKERKEETTNVEEAALLEGGGEEKDAHQARRDTHGLRLPAFVGADTELR